MLQRLLEGMYMPHGYCLLWEPWLVTLHAGSDLLIFGAYSAIPLAIWMFVSKRPNIEMKGLARLFAAFILWCGLTHIFSVITLWHPVYELEGAVKAVTAVISVSTALLIFPLIPKALAIPSPNELQIANAQLEHEIEAHKRTLVQLQQAREELEGRVVERTQDLQAATERFKALFEHAPVAMLMVARDGSIQQMNAAAEKVFDTDKSTLMSKPVEILLPEKLRSTHPSLRGAYNREPTARPMGEGRELYAQRRGGEQFPVEIGLNPIGGEGAPAVVVSIIDISARKKAEERMQLITRELAHRSKNLLAVIQGMARQALATTPDLPTFERSFGDRLQALARSHDLLVGNDWEGASIVDVIRAQLDFLKMEDASSITLDGPDIVLTPQAVQTLGLALHELATNSTKYGVLSSNAGTIAVSWRLCEEPSPGPHLEICWEEAGGPNVGASERKGFGSIVLERVVPMSFGGSAILEFRPGGLCWRVQAPLVELSRDGARAVAA
jgi:PAS domain S-box-containing protein